MDGVSKMRKKTREHKRENQTTNSKANNKRRGKKREKGREKSLFQKYRKFYHHNLFRRVNIVYLHRPIRLPRLSALFLRRPLVITPFLLLPLPRPAPGQTQLVGKQPVPTRRAHVCPPSTVHHTHQPLHGG